uniref:Uncharacterized protein n=1 Tax=Bos mutus grunniens TaxID=30521 RepID=A0A8B9WSV4_BOSMU
MATFWYYAKVELVPPTPAEIPTAIQSLTKIINSAKTGSFKQLTVKEALLNGLVATEVWMWFYVGEIIPCAKHDTVKSRSIKNTIWAVFLCKNQRKIPLTTPYYQLEYRLPKEQHDDNLYIFVTSLTLGQSE